MHAEIVSVGTELLLGTITDTNASYLAQRLAARGIDCYYVSQVGDNMGRLVDTLRRAWERSDLVIVTGGLGPTQDDLTREAIAAMLGETMEVDPELEQNLRAFFERRGVRMPERNLKQAALIPSAQALPNPVGTAPGWWVSQKHEGQTRTIIAMPGVPFEMKRMWEREVETRLLDYGSNVIVSRTLKVLGLGESVVDDALQDLMAGANPTLAPYAKQDGVHLRITAKAETEPEAGQLIARLEAQVRDRLGEAIYGADEDTPQGVVRDLLAEAEYSYALLEVGPPVIGAITPLLGWPNGAGGAGLGVGAFSAESIEAIATLLGEGRPAQDDLTLEKLAFAVRGKTGADVIMGIIADLQPVAGDNRLANAAIEIVLLTPDDGHEPHVTRFKQNWRTETGEIRRLAGLAAFNLLRLRLLKMKDQAT